MTSSWEFLPSCRISRLDAAIQRVRFHLCLYPEPRCSSEHALTCCAFECPTDLRIENRSARASRFHAFASASAISTRAAGICTHPVCTLLGSNCAQPAATLRNLSCPSIWALPLGHARLGVVIIPANCPPSILTPPAIHFLKRRRGVSKISIFIMAFMT